MSILQRTLAGTIDDRGGHPDSAIRSGAAVTAIVAGAVALLTGVLGLITLGL